MTLFSRQEYAESDACYMYCKWTLERFEYFNREIIREIPT